MLRNLFKPHEFLSSRQALLLTVAALILNLLFLLPLMKTPFLGDDSWCESTIRGFMELTNTSLGQLCWAVEKDYLKGGRWYPLVTYYYPLFYFASRETYKALVIGLILVNVMQLGVLVRSITRSQSMAIMAMLMPPLFFQLRLYHDPILSYYGLMQLETAFILGSLSCFLRYLLTEKRGWLWGSAALYGLNLLTYEAFYGVIVAYPLLAYYQWRKWISSKMAKALIPFIGLAVVNVLVMMTLRSLYTVSYEGNHLNLTAWTWGLTFAKEALGALPLSYFTTFPETVSAIFEALSPGALVFISVASVALYLWVCRWFKADRGAKVESERLSTLALLGLTLWITPCIIISGAVKYQQELRWGLAYLPVYVSYFGVMMLAVAAIQSLSQLITQHLRLRSVVSIASAALLVCVFTLNCATNLYVIDAYRTAELRPRLLVETAMKNGLFRSMPQGSYLICGLPVRPWDTPAFYRMHSGLSLQIVRPVALDMDDQLCTLHIGTAFGWLGHGDGPTVLDFEKKTQARPLFAGYKSRFDGRQGPILEFNKTSAVTSASPDVFLLTYSSPQERSGLVVLGRVKKLKANNQQVLSAAAEKLSIFVACQDHSPTPELKLRAQLIDLRSLDPGPWFVIEAKGVLQTSQHISGIMLTLESDQPGYGIEPRSVTVLTPHASKAKLVSQD